MDSRKIRKYILPVLLALFVLSTAGVWWGYAHLTELVQARLKLLVGNGLSIGRATVRWNRIELDQVRIARNGAGPFDDRFSCGRILVRPSLFSLFSGRLDISEIHLEKPRLLLEISSDGSVVKLLPARPAVPSRSSAAALPVRIATVRISNGAIDLLDWRAGRKGVAGISNPRERYHLTSLQNVSFSAGSLEVPASGRPVPVRLELASKGGGHLLVTGDIEPRGLDTHLTFDLDGLNIVPYRPYFLKPGDLDVSAGTLSASCVLSINNRILKAPGSLHLKGLALDHSGTRGVLLGVPAWALVSFLSDNRDEIRVPFSVNGSLDNPRFSVHQSLADQVATSLSSKLGVPTISGVGRGILDIGEKGVKGVLNITGIKK